MMPGLATGETMVLLLASILMPIGGLALGWFIGTIAFEAYERRRQRRRRHWLHAGRASAAVNAAFDKVQADLLRVGKSDA